MGILLRVSAAFEAATGVVAEGDGAYAARIEPGWDIAGNANGGYLIALAARAMADAGRGFVEATFAPERFLEALQLQLEHARRQRGV